MKDESPCTGLCIYNSQAGLCMSCGRTTEDLRGWREMSKEEHKMRAERAQKRLKEILENR